MGARTLSVLQTALFCKQRTHSAARGTIPALFDYPKIVSDPEIVSDPKIVLDPEIVSVTS